MAASICGLFAAQGALRGQGQGLKGLAEEDGPGGGRGRDEMIHTGEPAVERAVPTSGKAVFQAHSSSLLLIHRAPHEHLCFTQGFKSFHQIPDCGF